MPPPKLKALSKADAYNPLTDPNLQHYFSHPKVQTHLVRTGLIDSTGRILPADAARTAEAVRVVERAAAEEEALAREELEIRVSC
jgi:hypothetical protein